MKKVAIPFLVGIAGFVAMYMTKPHPTPAQPQEALLGADATQGLLNPVVASSTIYRLLPRNSSYGLLLSTTSPIRLSAFNCSDDGNGGKLTTDSSGNVICGADNAGGGAGGA